MSRDLLVSMKSKNGSVPNVLRILGHSPAALSGYLNYTGALATGALSARVREGIALVVAETNSCAYSLSAHSLSGSWAGLTNEEIAQARRASSADPKMNAILKFARLLVLLRGQVSEADIARAKELGITEAELVEVIAHVALSTLTNYLNIAADTVVDAPLVLPGVFPSSPVRVPQVA